MKHAIISYWRFRSFTLAEQSIIIKWAGPNVLILTTTASGTTPKWVVGQRRHIGDVTIKYSDQP